MRLSKRLYTNGKLRRAIILSWWNLAMEDEATSGGRSILSNLGPGPKSWLGLLQSCGENNLALARLKWDSITIGLSPVCPVAVVEH